MAKLFCNSRLRICFVWIALFLSGLCGFVQAESSQEEAKLGAAVSLKGFVYDAEGNAVSGAVVTLKNLSSGEERKTSTDNQGYYQLKGFPSGKYSIEIAAQNFVPFSQEIETSQTDQRLDFHIQLTGVEEQIMVAARYARSLAGLPLSATVVSREEMLDSTGRAADDALRLVSSVQLQQDNSDVVFPLVPSIAIRGIGVGDTATRALVLVDGLPINGGFFGQVFWNRAPKYTMESLEVVRGASSSLFGSFAMGGVVNIVNQIPTRRGLNLDLLYGENNRFQGNVQYGDVVLDDALAFTLNANYYDTDGYFLVPENEITPVDQKLNARISDVQGLFNFKLSDSTSAFFRIGHSDKDWIGGVKLQQTDSDVTDVAGGLNFLLSDGSLISAKMFYADEDFTTDNVRIVDDITSFVSNSHETTSNDFGLSGQWSKKFNGLFSNFSAGIDFRRISGEDDQDVFNTPDSLDAIIVGGGKQLSTGVFSEISLKPAEELEILGSLRYDNFKDQDGRIVTNGNPIDFPDRDFNVVSPRIASHFQFSNPVAIRGSYYGGFRAPTLAERYRSFETPTFRGLSNPFLKKESLKGGDLGLDFQAGMFSGQFNGFYNELDDFVGSAETESPDDKFTVINTNVAKIRSKGIEIIGALQVTQSLNLSANYTFTDAKVVEGFLTGNEVEGAPRNVFNFAVRYFPDEKFRFSVDGHYIDNTFQDITNEAPQDAHFIFNVFASYRIHRYVEILFTAENLFNDEYIADGFGQTLGSPRQMSGGIRMGY